MHSASPSSVCQGCAWRSRLLRPVRGRRRNTQDDAVLRQRTCSARRHKIPWRHGVPRLLFRHRCAAQSRWPAKLQAHDERSCSNAAVGEKVASSTIEPAGPHSRRAVRGGASERDQRHSPSRDTSSYLISTCIVLTATSGPQGGAVRCGREERREKSIVVPGSRLAPETSFGLVG